MGKKTGIRFFRWIKSDLPDCDPNPVLLLSVTKLNTSTTSTPTTTLSLQRPHTIFYDRTPIVPDTFDADDNNLPPNKSQLYDIKKRCDSYIDKIPEILENKKLIKNSKLILNNNSGKIGQTTSSSSSSLALPQKLDRNSNGNQNDCQEYHQTTPKSSSSLEYSKNKNLTKIDNNNDKNITETRTTTAASGGVHTVLKPKVLITRIKKSSDKIIENIIIDDYNNIKSATTTTSHRNHKKSSNCKIYNFIPKCTRRNDSTEPESLSSEETNNNLEINKTPTNNKLLLKSKNSYNSSVIMDRSVDSIGSCSLDVDADSTDFSDTSGSLNLVTPSSGKDINKEFIARFQERCQIVPQTTTTILDPCSGKVTTVLASPVTDSPITIKKPSYLNLACCVNGYSNLTTYDSKLRQNINKSREVSPIRPITHSLHYNRDSGNNYLVVPVPVPIRIDPPAMDSSEPHRSYMSTEKRIFTSQMLNENSDGGGGIGGKDVVDDASTTTRYKTTTFKTTSKFVTTGNSTIKISCETDTPTKSFIQQSVERLYGPGALATLYTHKRGHLNNNNNNNNNHSNNSNLTDGNGNLNGSNILAEKYLNNINSSQYHENNIYNNYTATKLNGHSTFMHQHHYENNENIKTSREITATSISITPSVGTPSPASGISGPESLPVLRHLRPEFRAQLPISPKKSMTRVSSINTEISSLNNNVHSNNKLITSTTTTTSITNTSPSNAAINNTSSTTIMTTNKEISTPAAAAAAVVVEKPKNGILQKHDENVVNSDDYDDNNHELNNKIKTQKNIEINTNMFSCNQANGGDVVTQKNHINHSNNSNDNNLTEKNFLIMDSNDILLNNNNNNLKINGDNNIIVVNNGDSCEKDGNHFLIILKNEQNRLLDLAEKTEKDIEDLAESSDVSDEIVGYLRSASGKARLLATKKMKQFEGLCHSNLNSTPEGEFPTTSGDLQGFWDMVMLQVNHVDSLFKEIESWKANNWKKPMIAEIAPPQGTKLPKRPIPLKTSKQNGSNKSEAAALAAQKREMQRKQLAEIRRQNKTKLEQQQQLERQQQQENGVEIFVAGGSTS